MCQVVPVQCAQKDEEQYLVGIASLFRRIGLCGILGVVCVGEREREREKAHAAPIRQRQRGP